MAEIEKDTADADGIYLFGNDNVLEFYPKFGFRQNKEYAYSKPVAQSGSRAVVQVKMDTQENRDRLAAAMADSTFETGCTMVDNPGLIFFYAAQFMQEDVYYWEEQDAWVIAEEEAGVLTLHAVFGKKDLSLDAVIAAFGETVQEAVLGFAPADPDGWRCEEYHEEDCTFFTKGKAFEDFADKKLRIPTLSHA